jgi:hypothetical protein
MCFLRHVSQMYVWRRVQDIGLIQLDCDLSVLSGLTVPVSIGLPVVELEMAVDFTSTRSTVFRESECPAFVNCHEAYQTFTSLTFFMESDSPILYEYLWMGRGFGIPDFKFQYTGPPKTASFRDVGGILAAGPGADVFTDRILELTFRGESHIVFNEISIRPGNVEWIASLSRTQWEWEAVLSDNRVSVVFDMVAGTDSLVLPARMRTESFCRTLFYGGSTEAIHCLGTGTEWIVADHDLVVPLRFGAIELVIGPRKIRFSNELEMPIRIGPLLMRASERIIFDYREGQISIVPRRDSRPWPISARANYKFLFEFPRIDETMNRIVAHHATTIDDSLVLESERPSMSVNHDGLSLTCWIFYRLDPFSGSQQRENSDLTGIFSEVDLTKNRDGILWRIIPKIRTITDETISTKLFIAHSLETVRMCAVVDRDLRGFDLPPPGTSDALITEVCAICLEKVLEGDMIQKMKNCGHRFHSSCARKWIHVQATCPTCRAPVDKMRSRLEKIFQNAPHCTIC